MGSLQYHQSITEKFPELIVEFTNLEYSKYDTFNIVGIQGGVELTHMIKYWVSFDDKE